MFTEKRRKVFPLRYLNVQYPNIELSEHHPSCLALQLTKTTKYMSCIYFSQNGFQLAVILYFDAVSADLKRKHGVKLFYSSSAICEYSDLK